MAYMVSLYHSDSRKETRCRLVVVAVLLVEVLLVEVLADHHKKEVQDSRVFRLVVSQLRLPLRAHFFVSMCFLRHT